MILNDRVGTMLEKEEKISEGQAGFRPNCSCVDHVYTLGEIIKGRKDAGLTTYILGPLLVEYQNISIFPRLASWHFWHILSFFFTILHIFPLIPASHSFFHDPFRQTVS